MDIKNSPDTNGLSAKRFELLGYPLEEEDIELSQAQTIYPREMSEDLPLSFAQQRLWFLDQFEPNSAVYNIPLAVRFNGLLNVTALERSLNEIVRRHESLRTTFSVVEEKPVQVIAPTLAMKILVVELRELPETKRKAEVQRLVTEEAQRPFDLSRGPLFRATLLRIGEEEYILFLTMHHIVSDGWSMEILFREISVLYEAFSTGNPPPLPELPIQYADFAVWQRQWLQGEVLEQQLSYWKKQLGDNPPTLELPTDYPRPAIQTYQGAMESLVLPGDLSESLKSLSQQEDVTLFMTLLAAFEILLYRYTGQEDIIVGSPIANRNRLEIEGLIGFFVNSLVLRTNLLGNPTFRELLGRVREVTVGAYAHQDIPFEKLLEELQPERDLSRTPLFQVWFNMLSSRDNQLELTNLTVEHLSIPEPPSKFDLTLYVREQDGEIRFKLVYNANLFDQARMAEMLEQYKYLLSQIVEHPDERINRFSLVTPKAKAILPDPTKALDSTWEGAVHSLFSQQAHQVLEQLAVVDSQESWTYKELDVRSNQLANYLIKSGIQPQDIVVIYGHRSASLVWALLGVLKAGAAFLILDSAYPTSRLIDYLSATKPRGWIQIEEAGVIPNALEEFVATLSCCCRINLPKRSTAAARGLLIDYSNENPEVVVGPDDLAYVAFTSGSTGKPKGVLGRHGPLTHFIPWQEEFFGLDQSDKFSMLSGLSHDPLQRDIFTPLCLGATVYIPDADIIGASGQLADWMVQEEITFSHLTPAMGQILTETASPDCRIPSLRYAFFIGDKLTRRDVVRLRNLASNVVCINSYGSTETQRAVGFYIVPPVSKNDQSKAVYPLGRGMPNVQLLVLNSAEQLAGISEIGEIYLRSPHLALGYLGDEKLTQARFMTNSFTGIKGDRLYRTGDLGIYLPDGNVSFFGRADRQVKIRGFRIEPGEVEAFLAQHPAVREIVVTDCEDTPGSERLVAYVVLDQKKKPTVEELRSFLKQRLPDYMIPSSFMFLDVLPLTPNSKIDYQALPEPEQARPDQESFVAPRTPVERTLSEIWAEVLDLEKIGIYDNFFELGGHSLLATRVMSRLRNAFQIELPLRSFFESPTIAEMALVITQGQAENAEPEDIERILAELEALSDKEVQRLLADEKTI